MKHKNLMFMVALLASLALMLAACGGGADTPVPEQPMQEPTEVSQAEPSLIPTNTPEPTDTPVPTETREPEPVADVELDSASLASPADLTSYRSTMRIVMKGTDAGQEVENVISLITEYTSDPLAQHIVITGEGLGEDQAAGDIEMYQVGDTMYMKMDEQWLSVPASEGEMLSQGIVTPDTLLEDTCGWKKQGDTELDGVKVQHWTLTKDNIEKCTPADELAAMGDITDAGGDLYIAVEGNYVALLDMFFEGSNLDMGIQATDEPVEEGRIEFHFSLSDVNQPFSIEIPEEALASGGMPEDIPLPPDAEEVTNAFGFISFQSASTPDEIAEFYKAAMPSNDWSEVSADEFGGMHMLEYSKGTRTASFMINIDEETNKTAVLITIQESGQ